MHDTSSESSSRSSFSDMEIFPQIDFRNKFLQKLAYNGMWVPQVHRSPTHQTVIIFDWDDTLFSAGQKEGGLDDLNDCIADRAIQILEMAMRAGSTYIITNAESGWVEYSAARWAPALLPILRKIPVISARDKFEDAFPYDETQWKIEAFLELQQQMDAAPIVNLVVLGDACHEMEAARTMGDEFDEGLVKTIKFAPKPNLEKHLEQLELVARIFETVVGNGMNLHVCLSRKLLTLPLGAPLHEVVLDGFSQMCEMSYRGYF